MERLQWRQREHGKVDNCYQTIQWTGRRTGPAPKSLPSPHWRSKTKPMRVCGGENFVQYTKMTKDFDLSTMTNSEEILPQYRDQFEADIKDIFIWEIGQNAITEMTKTVRESELISLPLYKLYTLFRLHFTTERNVHYSVAKFFLSKTRRRRNCRRLVETNSSRRRELRIRNNNRSRTSVIKILVSYRQINWLRPEEKDSKKRYVGRRDNRCNTRIFAWKIEWLTRNRGRKEDSIPK